jgi:hypothetical protein
MDDPQETKNLIFEPEHQGPVREMRRELHRIRVETGGAHVPLGEKRGHGASLRWRGGAAPGGFPPEFVRD